MLSALALPPYAMSPTQKGSWLRFPGLGKAGPQHHRAPELPPSLEPHTRAVSSVTSSSLYRQGTRLTGPA